MREETPEHRGPLRSGLTTGSCATAAALAAARYLLAGEYSEAMMITLPGGRQPTLAIADLCLRDGEAVAGVIKDAGDDPDATHGARLWVALRLLTSPGVRFVAGKGVGTVTRKGLVLAVGEPAINPVPRQMIREHLHALAAQLNYAGGFQVTVGIDNGERIALRTMNGRLGIVGGLSVLGTTGIVRPFSCSAYIASIHQSIDVARANDLRHVAACTGGTSERYAQCHYGLDDSAIIEMGDLFGAVLKYLRREPLPRLSLCSGFGKLSKFAAGHPDTHSRRCAIDFDWLAARAAEQGAAHLRQQILGCNTSIEALGYCQRAGVALGDAVASIALRRAHAVLPESVVIDVTALDRQGRVVGYASDAGVRHD